MLTALVWHGSVQNVRRAATIYLFLIHTWCYWGGCGSGGGAGRPLIKRLMVSNSRPVLNPRFLLMSRLAPRSVVSVWVRQVFKSSLSAQQTGEALHKHKSIYHLAARYLQSFPQCARDLRLIYGPFRCRNRNARHCPHTSMCPSGWHESNQSERHFSFATVRVAFNFRPVPSQLLCSNCSSLCNIIQIKQFCRY